jgi:hypothetical protein
MKKEISPAAIIAIIGLVVAGVAAFFIFGGGGGAPAKVDLKTIDPKDLRDEDPIRRGQPGYRERTTDQPTPG